MQEHRCPASILALFDREATKVEGRQKAIGWMKQMVAKISIGDAVWIPHPDTGELMRYVKDANMLA
jgi:hypothetical protein